MATFFESETAKNISVMPEDDENELLNNLKRLTSRGKDLKYFLNEEFNFDLDQQNMNSRVNNILMESFSDCFSGSNGSGAVGLMKSKDQTFKVSPFRS